MKKRIACHTSDKIVDFAEVLYRQTLRHHLCLYTYNPRVLQGISFVVDCSFYLCLSALLFWEAVTEIIWRELYEIWVKSTQARRHVLRYLLLVSEMAYER